MTSSDLPLPSREGIKGRGPLRRIQWGFACALALALAGSGSATAASDVLRRFPQSQITPQEWQAFLDEVKAKPGARDLSRRSVPSVDAIEVPDERTIYFFTRPGWAAHPAVVVERVLTRGSATYLQHDGYFAGSEAAFAQWFSAFQQRGAGIRKALQTQP